MDQKEHADLQKYNLNATQEAYKNYKANENSKIIQFLHITVLVILAVLSKSSVGTLQALLTLMGLVYMPFAYGFFYLKDFYNADVNMNSFFYEQQSDKNSQLALRCKASIENSSYRYRLSNRLCLLSVASAYIFIITSLFMILGLLPICMEVFPIIIIFVIVVSLVLIGPFLLMFNW